MDIKDLSLNYMNEYINLAENLNFTETANKFYISQSALSRHLNTIEIIIGTKLFLRTTHNVELTTEGKKVYDTFKTILQIYNDLTKDIEHSKMGIIGILSVSIMYYAMDEIVQKVFKDFFVQYPKIAVTLHSIQPYQAIQGLKEQTTDSGFLMKTPELSELEYDFISFRHFKMKVMVTKNHKLSGSQKVSPSQLKDFTMISLEKDTAYMDIISDKLRNSYASPNKIKYVEQVDMIAYAVDHYDAFFIGTDELKRISSHTLELIDIDDENYYFDMGFYYKKNNANKSLELFANFLNHIKTADSAQCNKKSV